MKPAYRPEGYRSGLSLVGTRYGVWCAALAAAFIIFIISSLLMNKQPRFFTGLGGAAMGAFIYLCAVQKPRATKA